MRTIDRAGIAALLGYAPRYVRDNITKRPDFPAPVMRVSTHNVRWRESDVLAWVSKVSQAA